MSRPGPSSARNLTLTEELERLEQSITLTLQEIDHNFSKAHRIVTTSILPLVEQYGEHSKNVWEASKFWKQFFEASANVSLSGYEELAGDDDETTKAEETVLDDTTSRFESTQADTTSGGGEGAEATAIIEDSLLDEAEMTGSTPRLPATKSLRHLSTDEQQQTHFANFNNPYESLRRDLLKGGDVVYKDDACFSPDLADVDDDDDTTMQRLNPTTKLPDMSMTPQSSSLLQDHPGTAAAAYGYGDENNTQQGGTARKNKDLLLHRVLDKNYRLQATPHKTVGFPQHQRRQSPEKERGRAGTGTGTGTDDPGAARRALWQDSPQSSPEMAAPKLRSDLYHITPAKLRSAILGGGAGGGPRTPGVSVQTPANNNTGKKRDIFAEVRGDKEKGKGKGKENKKRDEITWESDEDELAGGRNDDYDDTTGAMLFAGVSPPKTIQFALPPGRLLRTPAREASRRIVDDILINAGAAPNNEDSDEYSPTMVKVNHDILDDTF
ncbi:DASH complex subunit Ask1-domain-containing protein [Xylariomycetidae sp. FL2044]|nr:DASH complex subunit Ask1-domain-containing protein [Xylariomycetidae sp. FL2044]